MRTILFAEAILLPVVLLICTANPGAAVVISEAALILSIYLYTKKTERGKRFMTRLYRKSLKTYGKILP